VQRKKQKTKRKMVKTTTTTKQFNGKSVEVVRPRASRFYPAENEKPRVRHTKKWRPTKLRSSIEPGQVLILVAGRFRGKRVVFLKQLQPSGLLLVTGPFKINGVPLRRVNQAYVIATSTRVDISNATVPDHIDDAYFRRPADAKQKKTSDAFFEKGKKAPSTVADSRKADQKTVDAAVIASVKNVEFLAKYLNAKFSLTRNEYPHLLKF
jgi:large subunit ribosomal protein L6e